MKKNDSNYHLVPMEERASVKRGNRSLLSSWKAGDLDKFKSTLQRISTFPLNDICEESSKLRILDILAKENGSQEYFEELLNNDRIEVGAKNPNSGKVALHYAAEIGNSWAIEKLLEKEASSINIQDFNNDTPLHILIQKWESDNQNFHVSLDIMLNCPGIALNVPNTKGYTPTHLAAAMFEGPVQKIMEKFGEKIDLDTFRCMEQNETAREVIAKNFPELVDTLPPENSWAPDPLNAADYQYHLYYYLVRGRGFRFSKLLRGTHRSNLGLVNCEDGLGYTYLHKASEEGLVKAVETIIKLGGNINATTIDGDSAIVIAARNGHTDIFSFLLDQGNINLRANAGSDNLLHTLVQPSNATPASADCLRLLLSKSPSIIDINEISKTGQTAVHIATKNSDEQSLFLLLDHGAKLDTTNVMGETALDFMSEAVLRNYLDSKVTSNDQGLKDEGFHITLNYQFADYKADKEYILSTKFLNKIAQSHELRKLLSHPIFSTAIFLKWKRIRRFIYLYFAFYALFCALTTAHILYGMDMPAVGNNSLDLSTNGTNCSSQNVENISSDLLSMNCTSPTMFGVSNISYSLDNVEYNSSEIFSTNNTTTKSEDSIFSHPSVAILILIAISIIAVTEITQAYSGKWNYIKSLENWLQWGVVLSTAALLLSEYKLNELLSRYCPQISAIAILLIWLELFIVLGDHPDVTFFIDIFRRVSKFLFRFLFVHSALLVGFACSFYILFRNQDGPFSTKGKAIFKTIVMLTGEFEAGDIPLHNFPIVSHVIFVVFVFLVSIVLFNLLIGLAVSATKSIEDNPFLQCCISQVFIIFNYEDFYYRRSLSLLKPIRMLHEYLSSKNKKAKTLPSILYVFPNQKNRIEYKVESTREEDSTRVLATNFTKSIVEEMQAIVTNKSCHQQTKHLDKIDELKQQFEEEHKVMKNALIEILEQLKNNGQQESRQNYRKQMKRREQLIRDLKAPPITD